MERKGGRWQRRGGSKGEGGRFVVDLRRILFIRYFAACPISRAFYDVSHFPGILRLALFLRRLTTCPISQASYDVSYLLGIFHGGRDSLALQVLGSASVHIAASLSDRIPARRAVTGHPPDEW